MRRLNYYIKMKFLKFILIILLTACTKTYTLNELDNSIIKYEELPLYVRETIFEHPEDYVEESFILLDNCKNYEFHLEKTFMPWIKKVYIINVPNNIQYEISNYTAIPFIIYKDKLYIPLKSIGTDLYKNGHSDFRMYNLKNPTPCTIEQL